jgi:TolA-binding protein
MYKLTVLVDDKHRNKMREMRQNLRLDNNQIMERALGKLEHDGEVMQKLEDLDRRFDQLTSHLAFFQETYSNLIKRLDED